MTAKWIQNNYSSYLVNLETTEIIARVEAIQVGLLLYHFNVYFFDNTSCKKFLSPSHAKQHAEEGITVYIKDLEIVS